MRRPHLAVLRDPVLKAFRAFVRLANLTEKRLGRIREPEYRLVMRGEVAAVGGEPVLIVPDDLASVGHAEFIKPDVNEADIMVNTVHEQVAVVSQDTLTFGQPLAAPGELIRVSHPFCGDAESRPEIIGWIRDNQLSAAIGKRSQQFDAVALMDLVQPGYCQLAALTWAHVAAHCA